MTRPIACFFARVGSRREIDVVDFYAQDVRILSDLGFDVRVATRPAELRRADLYFAWFWTWAAFPVLAARLQRRPSVVTGVFNCWSYGRRPPTQRALIGMGVRLASRNVIISEDERRQLRPMFPAVDWLYSPLGVDTGLFSPAGFRRADELFTTATMAPGNAERKSIPELLAAAPLVRRSHPEVRFAIAGRCDEPYRRMVRDVGAEGFVEMLGLVSNEEKIARMRRCAAYVQPSRHEGFGLAILEAMSCGAPIVTSPVGAVPEVVGEEAAMVDGSSPEAIAEAVSRLLADPDERARLGARGRARAIELFSIERRKRDVQRILRGLGFAV
ncbi:MAG: glycosyltransferase family 4 protein [Chthonomonadales bacterium]|nr:glycosyltransferase family 4 protein [Chthonomonadales bacterium]